MTFLLCMVSQKSRGGKEVDTFQNLLPISTEHPSKELYNVVEIWESETCIFKHKALLVHNKRIKWALECPTKNLSLSMFALYGVILNLFCKKVTKRTISD